MTSGAHAAQIDLRFCDAAGELLFFGIGVRPYNLPRERFYLFGQDGIGIDWQAQGVANRVSRRVRTALCGFRAGAGPSIGAVGPDLTFTRHAALFASAGVCAT